MIYRINISYSHKNMGNNLNLPSHLYLFMPHLAICGLQMPKDIIQTVANLLNIPFDYIESINQ